MTEARSSAVHILDSLLDEIFDKMGQNLDDTALHVFEQKLSVENEFVSIKDEVSDSPGQNPIGSVAKVLEENLESDTSLGGDKQIQDQTAPLFWTEPKQVRKIQTTSLLLRRKRKDKRRHKIKPVLRLRGGCGDDENMDDGTNSNDDEDNDDDGKENHQKDKDKPDLLFATDRESVTGAGGDERDHRKESEMDIEVEPMSEAEGVKNAVGQTEEVKNGGEANLSEFVNATNRPSVTTSIRADSWMEWEQDREMLRPLPLDPPREPDLAYLNMTVDEAANEDGIEHFNLAKDAYRRSDAQVQAVREAQRDQRNVAGGIYQCQEDGKENFYLHIMKSTGKLLGIKLVHVDHPHRPKVQFETFAQMEYERYIQCSSQRVRVNLPEETETGFLWHGHGGNTYPLSNSVYKFEERVDNNIHYSAAGCERVTEAPGASQLLCSNKSCSVIFWHLSVIFFHRVKANQFEEAGQEHFAAMMSKSDEFVLLWTDKNGNKTRWTRLEHSERYEKVYVSQVSLERIRYVVAKGLLPPCIFLPPAYSPYKSKWTEAQPLQRISPSSNL